MTSSNLYLRMEEEREKVPQVLREDFIPSYVVSLLREKLGGLDNNDSSSSDSGDNKGNILTSKFFWKGPDDSNKWTDDSLLEDFAELESSLIFEDESILAYVNQVLSFGVNAMDVFEVDQRKFVKSFLSEIEFPHLELLWLLDCQYDLIPLSSYLMQIKRPARIKFFQKQFKMLCSSSLCLDKTTRERSINVLKHILYTLIRCSQCDPRDNSNIIRLKNIANDTLMQLIKILICDKSVPGDNLSLLIQLFKEAEVPNSTKKECFSQLLMFVVTNQCFSESPFDLQDVIRYQEKFSNSSYLIESQTVGSIINLLIGDPVENSFMIDFVGQSIRSPSRNWDKILRFVTEWINRVEYEATSAMKAIIKDLMRIGLLSEDEEKVSLAFVFARHCSLVAPKIFSRYEKWYLHMFDSPTYSPAKDPETFKFLTKVLSQWIQYEPSCFLQVQATFWPYFPPECRALWSDYVSLAKVRIAEYNEVESAMEFEPNSSSNPVQHAVEMAIKAYENSRTVPHTVAHMWMFKKQYYLEQFLPVLLKKPLGSVLSDARLRLIEVLYREGKIPTELYTTFKNSSEDER